MPGGKAILQAAVVIAICTTISAPDASADTVDVSELGRHTHVHGLAVDRLDPSFLLIATHHGLYRAGSDGAAGRISVVQDFMGFTPHPAMPGTLYASGHPAGGGNLGFIASNDNGVTWQRISAGLNGPVDFHQMTVSPADPRVIYGAYRGLQVSRDAGRSWAAAGPLPESLIDLSAGPGGATILYAATETGLQRSDDGGVTWSIIVEGAPVSLVEATADGIVYAFVVGRGFVQSTDGHRFELLSADWGDQIPLHMAIDPTNPARMFVATHQGAVLATSDGGATWEPYGGKQLR